MVIKHHSAAGVSSCPEPRTNLEPCSALQQDETQDKQIEGSAFWEQQLGPITHGDGVQN